MKKISVILLVILLTGTSNIILPAEAIKVSPLKFTGSYGAFIQAYGESVFDAIIEKWFDKETIHKIKPYKPKKDIENAVLNQINSELNNYNLAFGDLFICTFTTENKNIMALVLIYGTLKPTIRYYYF